MIVIYILKLTNLKYYVGRTKNINFRLNDHFNNHGSAWTTKYKPESVLKIYDNCDFYDEDKHTIKTMSKYGIDNVRGGSFTRITLSNEEIKIITKMINNASDKCFNCHMSGHFTNKCPYDDINNNDMLILKNKIIDMCKSYDLDNTLCIDIIDLKNILCNVDEIIFNNITEDNIVKLCIKINKSSIKGINKIAYQFGIINYIDFSIGLIVLLNKKLLKN